MSMISSEFIRNQQISFEYFLKEGTKTSYYRTSGKVNYLPERIGITSEVFAPVSNIGRSKYEQIRGQMKAKFKKEENSIYKNQKNTIHTSLYEPESNPGFIYGDIQETKDLIIFQPSDDFRTYQIFIFRGLLFHKEEVFKYLQKNVYRN